MEIKRIAIVLVAFCAFSGAAVGGAASMPVTTPDAQTAAGGPTATNVSTGPVSDCDLIDIDGENNTVSANITNNATASDGSTIQYRCGTDAATLDHDLIDIDGENNTVTVTMRAENGTIDFGAQGSATDGNGVRIGLNCGVGTSDDCDGVDIDGHNNSVTLIVRNDTGRTVHEFGANSSNVSWTAGEQGSESGANDGDSTTDVQGDSENDRTGSADTADNSNGGEDRSNGVLDMIVDGIPFVGVVTALVLGSALLVRRNDA